MGFPLRSIRYEWEKRLYFSKEQRERKTRYKQNFGYNVLSRTNEGKAKEIEFTFYQPKNIWGSTTPEETRTNSEYFLVGNFSNWEAKKELQFKQEGDWFKLRTNHVRHKDEYLILKRIKTEKGWVEEYLRDPATTYFSEEGNSVFWDYDDPRTYQFKEGQPELLHRTTKILQTDLPGLVTEYGKKPGEQNNSQFLPSSFKRIIESGVLDTVKELGFNTIQFLPVSQSIDGDNWKYRYLSPFPFALQKNWGTPDEFKQVVDECHKRGIAVILDIILSHAPYKEYKLFNIDGEDIGIHKWKNGTESIFLDEKTNWGTQRYRYQDENIRRFLTESALHYLTRYGVDGFRIDNVDGILRLGIHGQGKPREGGLVFLKELIGEIYNVHPLAPIHVESHYFYGDNSKMLVAPRETNERALGATAYSSSRLTYYLHTELMPKSADDISAWFFENNRKEKEFGNSNSTIADFHNHDAAAGLMEGRATGSYAYDALTLGDETLHEHATGKIRIMEALIAFGTEGRILDLVQTFLLQTGSFEHHSSIDWSLLQNEESKKMLRFKKRINVLLDDPAFWPENTINREFTNIDEEHKVLAIKRKDTTNASTLPQSTGSSSQSKTITSSIERGNEYVVLINLSAKKIKNYALGVVAGEYLCEEVYEGRTTTRVSQPSTNFEYFSDEILFETIEPYAVLICKKIN